jgi:hypothetical protein
MSIPSFSEVHRNFPEFFQPLGVMLPIADCPEKYYKWAAAQVAGGAVVQDRVNEVKDAYNKGQKWALIAIQAATKKTGVRSVENDYANFVRAAENLDLVGFIAGEESWASSQGRKIIFIVRGILNKIMHAQFIEARSFLGGLEMHERRNNYPFGVDRRMYFQGERDYANSIVNWWSENDYKRSTQYRDSIFKRFLFDQNVKKELLQPALDKILGAGMFESTSLEASIADLCKRVCS